ncbi:MAG: hypothetical protein O3A25_19530 [Acidobacteria bacterium]|nr:hypothetical protein [Acidobacteriota bacterium]
MHALSKLVTFGVVVAFASAVAVTVSAQTGSEIGTWKLNVAKSTFSPGPAPKSFTLVFAAAGQGVKLSAEGVEADGSKSAFTYTANYDGKDVPITGLAIVDTVSVKRINATTVERTDKKGGKVVQTHTRVMSADGKSFTSTQKGTNAQGQAVNNVQVFEKQ